MDLSDQFGPEGSRGIWLQERSLGYGDVGLRHFSYARQDPTAFHGWHGHHTIQVHDFPAVSAMHTADTKYSPGAPDTWAQLRMQNEAERDWVEHTTGPSRNTPKLFGWAEEAGYSKLHYMAGSRESRVMTPTMLGVAEADTRRKFGRSMLPSEDLSPHSARIVGRLQEAGVAGGEPASVGNDITFEPPNEYFAPEGAGERLSAQRVAEGRALGREVVKRLASFKRGHTPAEVVPQGEQLRLF